MHKTLLFLLFIVTHISCYAEDPVIVNCSITPTAYPDSKTPLYFNPSNNLRRKTGLGFSAIGKSIIIRGRLLDAACAPISGAIINIWHTNNYGIYQHELPPSMTNVDNVDGIDYYFAATGSATTDNLGYFSFVTIFPGAYSNRAPHINFLVKTKDFVTFETQMFFSDYQDNDQDLVLSKIAKSAPELKPLLIAYLVNEYKEFSIYKFNITLSSYNRYKN